MSTPESPAAGGSTRRPRATLSRDAIVDAAVAILDEAGLDGLTMRAVADRLGSGAMSLYRHVSGREELLDLVVARLTDRATSGTQTADWRLDLATLAHEMRAALLRRPNLTVLLTSRAASAGAGFGTLDHALGILREAGFRTSDAALANHALGNYVAGAALWEAVGLGGATGDERRARVAEAARVVAALSPDTAPNVRWASADLFAGTADDRFAYGLDVLLDGLATRLEATTGR
jgi:AcrR family transcriptional regulator